MQRSLQNHPIAKEHHYVPFIQRKCCSIIKHDRHQTDITAVPALPNPYSFPSRRFLRKQIIKMGLRATAQ
jgi:hypothetical protein